jgi:hypothetical protein
MSLNSERVMKMACEHLWLTLVLGEVMFEGEGIEQCWPRAGSDTAVLRAWHDRIRSSPAPFLAKPR